MNKMFIFIISFIIINIDCGNCVEKYSRVYFNINPEDRRIVVPMQLNDSITARMAFDTGAGLGTFVLDSTFCAIHSGLTNNNPPDVVARGGGSAWLSERALSSIYKSAPNARIGYSNLKFNHIESYNWKGYMNSSDSEGLFNIPKNDTTHVWELNFEHNYLEINSAEDFKMPANCLVFPMIKDEVNHYPFNIQLPIKIKCKDGDTLTINRTFMIDTGMSWDIALLYNAKELPFFNKREDAVWIGYLDSYFRYYTVDAMLLDDHSIDSLRIYTFDNPNSVRCSYLIGQNFLKRFNVFFDLKNRQIGFQPIKNFYRVINPNYRIFHMFTTATHQGKIIVKEVGNYKGNNYKTAGFQKGDEIVKLNGKISKNVTDEDRRELYKKETLIFDIIRKGKPMKIVVKVDKSEKRGD